MVMYEPDPLSQGKINVLERALSKSEQERFELQDKVSELNRQIEKITGYGPEYVRDLTARYETALAKARQALIDAQKEHKEQLEQMTTKIRRELDRYLTARRMTEIASGQAKIMEAARASLTDDVIAIVRKASEDNNPLILQPNVQGLGIDIVKLFRWARSKLKSSKSNAADTK